MEEHWEDIKRAADHSWGLLFIFMVACSTCKYTNEINTKQDQIIEQNKVMIHALQAIDSALNKNK